MGVLSLPQNPLYLALQAQASTGDAGVHLQLQWWQEYLRFQLRTLRKRQQGLQALQPQKHSGCDCDYELDAVVRLVQQQIEVDVGLAPQPHEQ